MKRARVRTRAGTRAGTGQARGTQLTLVDGSTRPWHLSTRTRHVGRAGVARARAELERATAPDERHRRAS